MVPVFGIAVTAVGWKAAAGVVELIPGPWAGAAHRVEHAAGHKGPMAWVLRMKYRPLYGRCQGESKSVQAVNREIRAIHVRYLPLIKL